jgi:multiple sugar transport system permease protein
MSEHSARHATPGRLVAITVTLLILLSPFLWLLQMSFKSNDQILQFPPPFIFAPTLENYASLWHSAFSSSFVNSLLAVAVTARPAPRIREVR